MSLLLWRWPAADIAPPRTLPWLMLTMSLFRSTYTVCLAWTVWVLRRNVLFGPRVINLGKWVPYGEALPPPIVRMVEIPLKRDWDMASWLSVVPLVGMLISCREPFIDSGPSRVELCADYVKVWIIGGLWILTLDPETILIEPEGEWLMDLLPNFSMASWSISSYRFSLIMFNLS